MSFPKAAPLFVGTLLSAVIVAASGCAAETEAVGSDEATVMSGEALSVRGAKAERLLGAFDLLDAVDHALGGRANVDVDDLSVLTSSHSALDQTDPLFLVPVTVATFDNPAESPSHRQAKDATQIAGVLFGAISAVDESLTDSAMGKTIAFATKVECVGEGPGAGDDPKSPPPTTATCEVTSDAGKTFHVRDGAALRIVQGFGLAGGVEHAMGGHFGVSATNLKCERRSNSALDDSNPLFNLPLHRCSADLAASGAMSVVDPTPHAFVLRKALEAAGLTPDSAMGRTGVSSPHVSCVKAPAIATTCTVAR